MATLGNTVQIVIQGVDNTGPASRSAGVNLQKLNQFAARSATALLAVGSAAAAAGVIVVKSQIDAADAMGKMAEKAGTSVEFMSALTYGANENEVATEGLTKGMKELNLEIEKNSKSLRDLNISTVDSQGKLRTVEDILPQVADRFADMADGAAKAKLAQDLFGKAGGELIPLLNKGSAGLKEYADEAARLGLIIDSKTAKEADEFNDNLTKLGQTVKGIGMGIAKDLLPHLLEFSGVILDIIRQQKPLDAFFLSLNKGISSQIPAWKQATDAIVNYVTWFRLGLMGEDLSAVKAAAFASNDSDVGTGTEDDPIRVVVPNGNTPEAAQMNERALALNDELVLATIDANHLMMAEEEMRFTRRLDQIDELQLKEEDYRQFKEMAEKEHANKVARIHQQQQQQTLRMYSSNFGAIGDMFGSFAALAAATGKKNSKLFKSLMYAQAVFSTAAGIARAFADHSWPMSAVVAATVGASGAAQIATIASQPEGGIAHGGMTSIPEESTWLLQKGERVLSPNQNEDLTEAIGSGGLGGRPIMLQVDVDGRGLFELLFDASRDGRFQVHPRAVTA